MRLLAGAACAAALLLAGVALANPMRTALGRPHHLHRPPSNLPSSLSVDEQEWSVIPSQTVLAAGWIRFQGYNRGMDNHNMELIGPRGAIRTVSMTPGSGASIVVRLPPGRYQLICSLYYGTAQSHDAKGMHAWVTVR